LPLAYRKLLGKAYALQFSMTANKFNRSRFCYSISLIGAANPLRSARLDFVGAVTLVCGIGMFFKLIQMLLAD